MARGMNDGGNNDQPMLFDHFVNNTVGKPFRITPNGCSLWGDGDNATED
jgi:hypothetical protein